MYLKFEKYNSCTNQFVYLLLTSTLFSLKNSLMDCFRNVYICKRMLLRQRCAPELWSDISKHTEIRGPQKTESLKVLSFLLFLLSCFASFSLTCLFYTFFCKGGGKFPKYTAPPPLNTPLGQQSTFQDCIMLFKILLFEIH